jgi:ABC-type branched-subunit amino acid transport system ATPase component
MAVLIVEHDMDFVMSLVDRVVVMEFGEKIAEGLPAESRRTRPCSKPIWEVCVMRNAQPLDEEPLGGLRQGRGGERRQPPVGEGKIVTVIGPNGAGKTTTLSAIMGLLPSSGEVAFDGSIEQVPEVERMVVRGMNLVPEKRELFGSMSIEDNLLLGAFQRHRTASATTCRRWKRCTRSSRASRSAAQRPAPCRAASARCWRWAAR